MRTPNWFLSLVVAAVAVTPSLAVADDGLIGVFADLSATQTTATFSIGVPRTLYVLARLDGLTAGGITGAEFRVVGLPPDWVALATPNPAAAIALGDPFHSVGQVHRGNVAFAYCTGGTNQLVLLYTVVVIATSEITPTDLVVAVGDPPTNPTYASPVLTICDGPAFSPIPAVGGPLHIAARGSHDLDYPQPNGYDNVRGVLPEMGLPGEVFHFRVVYFSSDGQLPAPGSPQVELDANGDGDAEDPGEGTFTMAPMDQDSTLANGKEYRYDVALGEPVGSRFWYRFRALDSENRPVAGNATVWHAPFVVGGDLVNLGLNAGDIRVYPTHPNVGESCTIFAALRNLSDRNASNTSVTMQDVFGHPIAQWTLTELGPRASTEVAATWRFADLGLQPVVVRIEPGPGLTETVAVDNVASHGVFVGGPSVGGRPRLGGLPPLVTVPAIAPFGFSGNATYATSDLPVTPLCGGWVIVRPSWGTPSSLRTDASGSFSASFVAPSAPGLYAIGVSVTDGACADSTVVTVQVESEGGPEPAHGPNLTGWLTATAGPGCPPAEATIRWGVANRGDRDSAPTTMRLLMDGVTTVYETPVGALAPGAEIELTSFEAPFGSSGLHALSARVDPSSTVLELREDDNLAVARLQVPPACLDLAVEAMRFTSLRACAVETLGMVVRVTNRGCTAGLPARVALRNAVGEIGSALLPALAAGQSVDLPFVTYPAQTGCTGLTFAVDPDRVAGTDCEARNDRLGAGYCVITCDAAPPVPHPDFAVQQCDLTATPPHAAIGDSVRFRVRIRNVGPAHATQTALVRFRVGDVQVGEPVALASLAAGASTVVESSSGWQVGPAPAVVTVSVDPNGQVEETLDNNSTTRPLPWELRLVQLPRCTPPPAMFSTCTICRGVPFTARAQILNDGLLACDSVQVAFVQETPTYELLGSVLVPSVAPGGTCVAATSALDTLTLSSTGSIQIAAFVDPGNLRIEPDESNNRYVQIVSVSCSASPDLVAAIRLPEGPVPQPGDTVRTVYVQVRNRGQAAASRVQARLQLDGLTLCDLEMGDIAPGAMSEVACTTPWVAGAGCAQRLQACADPLGRIGETDENNNCATSGISSSPPTDLAVYPYSIRVTPPSPAPLEPVLIQVSVYSRQRVASTCRVTIEWSLPGEAWHPLQDIALQVPGGYEYIENAVTCQWTPPSNQLGLRFQLLDVCPFDLVAQNNVVYGTLPWFEGPNDPVTVTGFAAESTPDGVVVRWQSGSPEAVFALERRPEGSADWQRLPAFEAVERSAQEARYEVLDRTAPAGLRLEYRLLVTEDAGPTVVAQASLLHDAALPQALALHPLRPNPFRTGTLVEFSVPAPRALLLSVFDAAGRRVAVLRDGMQPAGRHAVSWDGRADDGRSLPAGVYFCRLSAGGFVQTQRVVLVR